MDNTDLWLAMRQTKYNRTLNSISKILNDDDRDPMTTVQESFNLIVEAVHAEAGTLWIHQRYGDGKIHPVSVYKGSLPEGFALDPGEGIAGKVIQSGTGSIVIDCQKDPRWAGKADATTGFVTKSMMCFPLIESDGCVGCIQIINKSDGLLFDNTDFDFGNRLTMGVGKLFAERRVTEKLQRGSAVINKALFDDVLNLESSIEAEKILESIDEYKNLPAASQKKLKKILFKARIILHG